MAIWGDKMQVYQYINQKYNQFKIKQNNRRISELQVEWTIQNNKHQKYYGVYRQLEQGYENILTKIEENRFQYQKYADKKILVSYSNQIQEIVETIEDLDERINLIQLMIENKKQNHKLQKTKVFLKWYQQNKQLSKEDSYETIGIIPQYFHFIKIYYSIVHKQNKIIHLNDVDELQNTEIYYQHQKEQLIIKQSEKEQYLERRKIFLRNYRIQNNEFENKKRGFEKRLDYVRQLLIKIVKEKTEMQKEIEELVLENQELNPIKINDTNCEIKSISYRKKKVG